MNSRFKENSEHAKGGTTKSLLSGLNTQQIKNITVSIRRPHVQQIDGPTAIQTSLDDPTALTIHRRKGEGEQPIFARKDIVVNVEEHLEERIVSTSPDHDDKDCTSRHLCSRSHSRDSYRRSSSMDSTRSCRSSPMRSSLKSNTTKDDYLDKRYGDASRKKSVTSDYPNKDTHHKDYDKRSKGNSPKPGSSKGKHLPAHDSFRSSPPRKYDKTRSYSRSPRRSGYSRAIGRDKDKYARRRTRSPNTRRRSCSPNTRKRTPSPYTSKRRSRSHSRTTPKRDVSRSRRSSKSPYDDKKKYTSTGSSRYSYFKRRTPSPYNRKRSRSPYRSRKRSITPHRDRDRFRRRDRSKSPRGHRVNSVDNNPIQLSGYKGVHPEFSFYGPDTYWLPGPFPRPGFVPRGMVPPFRGLFRPPYFNPRPYMPFPYPEPYCRPRFPIQYNRPFRPKLSPTTTATTTSTVESPPTTVSAQVTSTNPIVEVEVEANEVNSNVTNDK